VAAGSMAGRSPVRFSCRVPRWPPLCCQPTDVERKSVEFRFNV
jgi:hypothetical protein